MAGTRKRLCSTEPENDRCWQLSICSCSGAIWRPHALIAQRGIGNDQQLAHDGDDRDFCRLAGGGFTPGWVTYYRYANCRTVLREIDQWLRRKLRCVRLKHCKAPATIAAFLRKNGVKEKPARQLASSGKG